MSKWRVELDTSFNTEADAVSFLNLLRDIQGKLFAGVGNEKIDIISKCRYHECFHDEIPPKQCGNYVNYDLKKPIPEAIKTTSGDVIAASELTKGDVI